MILDVSKPSYYYPYIITFTIVFGVIQILIWIFHKHEHQISELNDDEKNLIKQEDFLKKGKKLKVQYMSAYLLAKAAMWAKAPYTFMLFSTYYGFSVGEIGFLYLIDAFCSLFSGPFVGILADTFGRKVIALIYPLNTIVILLMRMSGITVLCFMAQVMTGFAGNILATSFESWLNFEIIKIYGDHDSYIQHFRKNMFSRILFYDSILSLIVTIIGAFIYNFLGIFFALSLSILLAGCSSMVIIYTWSENKPNSEHKSELVESFKEGFKLLKHPQILFLGLVDSFYNCAIQIIVFVWTPVLQETAENKNINPAMIYLIMILGILINNKCLELLHHYLRIDFFYLTSVYLFIFLSNWLLIYWIDSFRVRLICLALINGSGGLFNPVVSYLKSIILVEQYRTLLMNLFRIPLNIVLITMLFLASYFNPLQICLIVGVIMIIPLLSSIYLVYFHIISPKMKKHCELKGNKEERLKIEVA